MGTRAMILISGKPALSTHWDGYPDSLGADLKGLKKQSIKGVVQIAKKHTIDAVDTKFAKAVSGKKYVEKFNKGKGDFYEYEYNVGKNGIKYRSGSVYGGKDKGKYLFPAGKWKTLTTFGKAMKVRSKVKRK